VGARLTGGASVEWNGSELDYLDGIGFAGDQFQYAGNAATVTVYDGSWTGYNLVSFFARANATWKDKYLFTGSLRADGSSRFGEHNRYGVFPAVSLGWQISREPFMEGLARHGDLKLRASYGVTGNQDISDNFAPLSRFSRANYGGTAGIGQRNFGNPDLRWEQLKLNLGFVCCSRRSGSRFSRLVSEGNAGSAAGPADQRHQRADDCAPEHRQHGEQGFEHSSAPPFRPVPKGLRWDASQHRVEQQQGAEAVRGQPIPVGGRRRADEVHRCCVLHAALHRRRSYR
jgi:hypothetical protein